MKQNALKVARIVLPFTRDMIENTGQWARMLGSLASYIAPAAIMVVFMWDAVQYLKVRVHSTSNFAYNLIFLIDDDGNLRISY